MSGSARDHRGRTDARSTPTPRTVGDDDSVQPDPEALLSLLSDEYARDIVEAVSTEALPAREIATRLDISRATVYRRLNRLEEAGVLEASMAYDPDGNHRQHFRATLDTVELSLEDGTFEIDRVTGIAG